MVSVFLSALYSKVYYAKIEPYEIRTISSNVSGEVLFCDYDKLGKKLSSLPVVKIDDTLDKIELNSTIENIKLKKQSIKLDEELIKNLKTSLEKKLQNYNSIKDLSIKSKIEKDNTFFDIVNTKNQIINTQKELDNLNSALFDLEYKKAMLEKRIKDKTITAKGFVLYEIMVRTNQVVNPSTPLVKVADISKALLSIYVDADELKNINKKIIYINGKKTNYKPSRVYNIADSINLSKYRVDIVVNPPEVFSKLVKVEFKDE